MPQNKLKLKVEALTRVVRDLTKQLNQTTTLCEGTLTAFQFHIGKEEWEKIVEELYNVEKRRSDKDNSNS